MAQSHESDRSNAQSRAQEAEDILAKFFASAKWKVDRQPVVSSGHPRADLLVQKPDASYVVEVKAAAEGRGDRLIPLWSQACLQAMRAAGDRHVPLAVVAAPRIAPRAAEQVLKFAAEFAPDAAVGVIDFEGLRLFRGPHLEGLDRESAKPIKLAAGDDGSATLFSDLNQWMLKVLLAPELSDALLSAPRGRYRNASQLARAANVSVMSAFRFVQQLERDGHLHESAPFLTLVRRETLFRRWQTWSEVKRVKEVSMRFLLRGDPKVELGRMLRSGRACLALFAAADALGLGFVDGVPPHVYVSRLGRSNIGAWKNIVPINRGEAPDLILREAPAPQSVFRALVRPDDQPTCDAIQVWLDVATHPARGAEQAEQIRRRVLAQVIEANRDG
jgi:hypothetical protein